MKEVKLGDVAKIITGKLDANAASENGKYPFFTCSRDILRIDNYAYDCECVLVAGNGDLNVKYYKGKFNAYQRTYIIEIKEGVEYSTIFVYWYLQLYIDTLRKNSVGSTIKYIKIGDLTGIALPLISLPEQERIVALLDKQYEYIDMLKNNAEHQLKAAKDLFQSALKELLTPKEGWVKKQIGDICEIIGGSTPKTKDPSNWDGDYYWVTPAELDGSKYYGATKRTITKKGAAGLRLLPIGTVLLSSRAPIGKVAITTVPMYCNQGFKNVVCPHFLYNEYVYWYILSSVPVLERMGVGTTFKELSKGKFSTFQITYPTIEEQQRIASRLDTLSEHVKQLQTNYEQTITLCNDLKQALLKSIFE